MARKEVLKRLTFSILNVVSVKLAVEFKNNLLCIKIVERTFT
jgi:hypothetical protein